MTVGELRQAIEGLPDSARVELHLSSNAPDSLVETFTILLDGFRAHRGRLIIDIDGYYAHCECGALVNEDGNRPECEGGDKDDEYQDGDDMVDDYYEGV